MSTLYKYAGDIIEVAASDNWIHFRTKEDAVFSARTFNGDRFPDVSQHIEIKGEKVEFPKQVIDITTAFYFCEPLVKKIYWFFLKLLCTLQMEKWLFLVHQM